MDQQHHSPSHPETSNASVDLEALEARQQATWASADFAFIGTTLQISGEALCEAIDLQAGSRVLDVACGNGNATLAAARRFCRVTGLDYVPALLERAAERAAAERLNIEFITGDAEVLPFPAGSFDAAVSTYGVMFAPDQERAAREISRVVRRGGKIGLANWTPEGFIGGMLRAVGKYVAPPAGVNSPLQWGTEARLRQLFPDVASLSVERKMFVFRYESADHFIDVFRRFYGPMHKAFAALDAPKQEALTADLRSLIATCRTPGDSEAIAVPGEYLEVVIVR